MRGRDYYVTVSDLFCGQRRSVSLELVPGENPQSSERAIRWNCEIKKNIEEQRTLTSYPRAPKAYVLVPTNVSNCTHLMTLSYLPFNRLILTYKS